MPLTTPPITPSTRGRQRRGAPPHLAAPRRSAWHLTLGALTLLACSAGTVAAPPAEAPPAVAGPAPVEATGGLPQLNPREARLVPDLDRVLRHLTVSIGERNGSHVWQLADAIDFTALELEATGFAVDRRGYEVGGEIAAQNLVAEVRGDLARDEVVVVGAHLDSAPGSPSAGAAAGVAAVLALARELRAEHPRRTVRFVLFSLCEGEQAETEAAGSRVYARAATAAREQIVAVIALDSVGRFAPIRVAAPPPELAASWPTTGDFLALIAAEPDRDLLAAALDSFTVSASIPAASAVISGPVASLGPTDAWGFAAEGIPTLRVTDTAGLRDPAHGSAQDLPDRVSVDSLARVVVGLESMVLALAGDRPAGSGLATDPGAGLVVPAFD